MWLGACQTHAAEHYEIHSTPQLQSFMFSVEPDEKDERAILNCESPFCNNCLMGTNRLSCVGSHLAYVSRPFGGTNRHALQGERVQSPQVLRIAPGLQVPGLASVAIWMLLCDMKPAVRLP